MTEVQVLLASCAARLGAQNLIIALRGFFSPLLSSPWRLYMKTLAVLGFLNGLRKK